MSSTTVSSSADLYTMHGTPQIAKEDFGEWTLCARRNASVFMLTHSLIVGRSCRCWKEEVFEKPLQLSRRHEAGGAEGQSRVSVIPRQ